MSNNTTNEDPKQKSDARIVQAIRNLKSTKNLITPLNQGQESTNDDIPFKSNGNTLIDNDTNSNQLSNKATAHGTNKFYTKKIESTRISIDGDRQLNQIKPQLGRRGTARLPSSKIALIENQRKTKTAYQKNILSEANLIKHKQTCYNMLKADADLKKLCASLRIAEESFNSFLQDQLFNNKTFLFKLEMIILNDMNENSSYNKIHSVNKGKATSFKAIKEKFFKEEIKKILEIQWCDIQFEEKRKVLNLDIARHIEEIQNYEF